MTLRLDGSSGFQRGDRGINPTVTRLIDSYNSQACSILAHSVIASSSRNPISQRDFLNKQRSYDKHNGNVNGNGNVREVSVGDLDTEVLYSSVDRSIRNSTFIKDKNRRGSDFVKDTCFSPIRKSNSGSFGSAIFDPKNIGVFYNTSSNDAKKTKTDNRRVDSRDEVINRMDEDYYNALLELIQDEHGDRDLVRELLSSRVLHPFYEIEDVEYFIDLFNKVDHDLCADLDVEEWCQVLGLLNSDITEETARQIFTEIDSDKDGKVTIQDTIPVIFCEATGDQQKLILAFSETEMIRKYYYRIGES